jgi:hypothetical protein
MMSSSIFLETLRKAKLEAYHDNLKAFGIDSLQQITLLTMQGLYTLIRLTPLKKV